MLTGYNTDVEHDGRVFHVQTEDKGNDNPLIESLIYVGGQILAARKNSYADMPRAERTEERIAQLIERQHQGVVRDIRLGKFDPPGSSKTFGEGIISDRSFDELVREFIEEAATEGDLPGPRSGRGEA